MKKTKKEIIGKTLLAVLLVAMLAVATIVSFVLVPMGVPFTAVTLLLHGVRTILAVGVVVAEIAVFKYVCQAIAIQKGIRKNGKKTEQ